jgi:hypothetical protein
MKALRTFAGLCIVAALALQATSCVSNKNTKIAVKKDNGNHKGWYKNPNNPHNPAHSTAKNAGSGNGNASSKSKKK